MTPTSQQPHHQSSENIIRGVQRGLVAPPLLLVVCKNISINSAFVKFFNFNWNTNNYYNCPLLLEISNEFKQPERQQSRPKSTKKRMDKEQSQVTVSFREFALDLLEYKYDISFFIWSKKFNCQNNSVTKVLLYFFFTSTLSVLILSSWGWMTMGNSRSYQEFSRTAMIPLGLRSSHKIPKRWKTLTTWKGRINQKLKIVWGSVIDINDYEKMIIRK